MLGAFSIGGYMDALKKNLQNKNEVQTNTTQQQIAESKNNQNKILRFKINNYELTKSFTTLFFSEPEADGSFLLTGDRTYNLGNQKSRETFYMLFRAISPSNSEILGNYSVAVSVMQDIENPNSLAISTLLRNSSFVWLLPMILSNLSSEL